MFGICLRDKDKKRKERASARFEKELDVVNFMRKQLKLKAISELILTKVQKSKVKNDYRFSLDHSISEESEDHQPNALATVIPEEISPKSVAVMRNAAILIDA